MRNLCLIVYSLVNLTLVGPLWSNSLSLEAIDHVITLDQSDDISVHYVENEHGYSDVYCVFSDKVYVCRVNSDGQLLSRELYAACFDPNDELVSLQYLFCKW